MIRRFIHSCAVALLLAWMQPALAELRVSHTAFDPVHGLTAEVVGNPTNYYVLYRGDRVTQISIAVDAQLGQSGSVPLGDATAGARSSQFYRALEVPVTASRDLDGDGLSDVYELGLAPRLNPLDASDASQDPDGDGMTTLQEYLLGTDPFSPSATASTGYITSPDQLETGVSVNRETIITFGMALAPGTTVSTQAVYAVCGGRRLLTRAELSTDRKKLTLFYLEPVPGASRVRVTIDGGYLNDNMGRSVDGDLDGLPGGIGFLEYETFGNRALGTTAVVGQVFASELQVGGNGESTNRPLAGVIITVDGAEETLRATTDSQGRFTLQPAPAGRFFVHIDGRIAQGSSWPSGDYYPVVGKAWEAEPNRTNNLAGGTGVIYLPLVVAGTLQTISPVQTTAVTFPATVLAQHPELMGVEVQVPPNALFNDNGTRGGRLGIAPVAPDRIPSPLPPGLALPLVITIQTDGPQNFDRPVPVRFPNLPDPDTGVKLGPGQKSALWSFDHDTGRWELMGPMTVTADGNFVECDAGVGVRQPGWHGVQPGVGANGGPLGGPCGGGGAGPGQNCHQNPNFRPDDPANYNGCGPDGWDYLVPDNPNGLLFPCATFFDACKAHDIGYNTCGKPKQQTDDGFLAGMLAACDCLDGLKRTECQQLAVLYHRAVTGGGAGAYDDAQAKACTCDTPPPSGCGGSGPSLQNTVGAQALAQRLQRQGGDNGNLVPQLGPHRFAVVDLTTGQVVQRGHAGTAGIAFSELILAPNRSYDLAILQEKTLWEGKIRVTTGASGSRLELPPILVQPPSSWDFDGDGLHDVGELVMGTDRLKADSDGDGVSDGAEVMQGGNPLDGTPLATGVIGTAPTPGKALDVAALNDIVVTANDTGGVALFNVSDPFSPKQLGLVDTPGQARSVAFAGTLIAVADGSEGLAVIDATVPSVPFLAREIQLGSAANAVAAVGSLAYVGLQSGTVATVDLATGTVLERFSLGTASIQDIVAHQDTLYVLAIGRLYLLPLDGGELRVGSSVASLGTVGAGARRLRLFVGGGLAYATFTSGYDIIDVSDVDAPTLVRRNTTAQVGWKQMVATGSGFGLATVGANSTDDGAHDVSLYSVGADGRASDFLATFVTPGLAMAVTVYNGLAYVADGTSGLQVINYLAFDQAGQAPQITLTASFSLNPAQAEEGKLVRVQAIVADDVQVRNVEFYVDDRLQATDGGFEFETRFVTPVRTAQRSSFTLRAKATDTGGNVTWTDPVVVQLVPDATPPRVVGRFPAAGAIEGTVRTISATFSEPVEESTLTSATVRLVSAGADGGFGTDDDSVVNGGVITWRGDLNAVFLTFASNLPPGFYQVRLSAPLADLAGNALAYPVSWTFWVLGTTDNDHDGVPDNIEAALGLDPTKADTNGNGILDGNEDLEGDRLPTSWELVFGYDPRVKDSNNNGVNDDLEDPDNDGLSNAEEASRRLSPVNADSDGDGWDDLGEVLESSNPLAADSTPVIRVSSAPVSLLNALPAALPSGTQILATSSPVTYLNALSEPAPAGTTIDAISLPVSYLNAVAAPTPAGTVITVPSGTVSYLNAVFDVVPPGTLLTVPSPVVSYRNQ